MATETDLLGVGMSSGLAGTIGLQPQTLAAAGTTAATAAVTATRLTEITIADASHVAVIFPSNAAVAREHFLYNTSDAGSDAATICVPVGHYLNGSLNGTLSLAKNKLVKFYQYKRGYWASNLTA